MFADLLCIILIVSAVPSLSEATQMTEMNATNAFLSLNIQLAELRAEQTRQAKLIDGLIDERDQLNSRSYPRNCAEATASNGIIEILISSYSNQPFRVNCDALTRDGGWTMILRRMDGSVDFHRSWSVYKRGFGDLDGEFFLGLDKIHALTAERSQELLVVLEDYEGKVRSEIYEKFAIGDEQEAFLLHTLGKATGTAGDSLRTHHGMKFTTRDRDNDVDTTKNCGAHYTAAWWYRHCHDSNLAGVYGSNATGRGINWRSFRGVEYSLKTAVMLLRPRK